MSIEVKKAALAEIAWALLTHEARLYDHHDLRFLAMKGTHERLVQIHDCLLALGVVSWIVFLNHGWRLASTDSRLLLKLEVALKQHNGIPLDLFNYFLEHQE